MSSTFAGIELGKRSLMAQSDAISTAGHNVANADVEGYSRQRVHLRAFDPLYRPDLTRPMVPGQIGQGVSVESIRRVRDELLDTRITAQSNTESYWGTRNKYYTMLDQIYNEPADTSIRSRVDQFWQGWQELTGYPDSQAARQVVVTRGETLVDAIRQRNLGLRGIGDMLNGDIEATVRQVNDYARQIADVNRQITNSRALGDNPNDLLDRRDLLVDNLAQLIPVTTDTRDPDEFMVHTAGHILVQGGAVRAFEVVPLTENNGYSEVRWADTQNPAAFDGGTLGALVELRDVDVRRELQSLDTMAINFADAVNYIHRNAVGANGVTGLDFFVQQPFVVNANGSYDGNGDGVLDSSYIFRITGTNRLEGTQQTGLQGVITIAGPNGNIDVPYNPTDTVDAVIARINHSSGEVKAYLDRDNRLALKGTTAGNVDNPDFVIRHVEDSGFFLTGYAGLLAADGPGGAYDWAQADAVNLLAGAGTGTGAVFAVAPTLNPSAYLVVNNAVRSDVRSVAAAYRGPEGYAEAGDGRAAADIASVRNTLFMIGQNRTLDDYFAETVTNVGLKAEQAENQVKTQGAIMGDLRTFRASISGVNVDEELADLIKFQHGYNAAAKFVSIMDELLDTIINRLGV
ncbi:MAG: flagellar hook-associated protein FlgK [Spirochaetaceae bacterium]|jgi:flagellar hook-associated protein 1 FlgK|nr:flagellar hook-associated protein FlgK [Spirochaetaceae bacterium]